MKISKTELPVISGLIILTILSYANILSNGFAWDDEAFVLSWETPKSIAGLPKILAGDVPEGHNGVYRPVRGLFYLLAHLCFKQSAVLYHTVSLLIHLSCVFIVYLVIKKITGNHLVTAIAAAIFGVHPLHVEAISFLTTSFDIIGVIFFLLALYFYLDNTGDDQKLSYGSPAALIFATLAFFTYELTVTLPILIVIYEFIRSNGSTIKETRQDFRKYLPALPLFVSALIYMAIRMLVLQIVGRGTYLADSFYLTMIAMVKALFIYLKLLVLPVKLSINHIIPNGILALSYVDSRTEAVRNQTLFSSDFVIAFMVIAATLILALRVRKKEPLITFSIIWIYAALLPVMYFIPQAAIMTEKYAYIPSIGYCLLAGLLTQKFYNRFRVESPDKPYNKTARHLLCIFIALLIVFYGASTFSRNFVWKDNYTLWEKTVSDVPESSLANYNLGRAYHINKDLDNAIKYYLNAIYLNPAYQYALFNLALAYQEKGDLATAGRLYVDYLRSCQDFQAYYNLGLIYKELGDKEMAEKAFKNSIAINSGYIKPYLDLAILYISQNNIVEAAKLGKLAAKIDPSNDLAKNIAAIE